MIAERVYTVNCRGEYRTLDEARAVAVRAGGGVVRMGYRPVGFFCSGCEAVSTSMAWTQDGWWLCDHCRSVGAA